MSRSYISSPPRAFITYSVTALLYFRRRYRSMSKGVREVIQELNLKIKEEMGNKN
jgi:hypothetical protein